MTIQTIINNSTTSLYSTAEITAMSAKDSVLRLKFDISTNISINSKLFIFIFFSNNELPSSDFRPPLVTADDLCHSLGRLLWHSNFCQLLKIFLKFFRMNAKWTISHRIIRFKFCIAVDCRRSPLGKLQLFKKCSQSQICGSSVAISRISSVFHFL